MAYDACYRCPMNEQPRRFLSRLTVIMLIAGLTACGGEGSVSSIPSHVLSSLVPGRDAQVQRSSRSSPQTDWDSFGYDLQRTGYNPNETVVGTGNVGSLQKVWSFTVGKRPMREPVLASGVMVNGTPTNVVYFGSSFGATIYALNAATGAVIWQKKLPSVSTCGGSQQFGVGATPAIDRAHNIIYVGDGNEQVHALNLSTGAWIKGWPVKIGDNPIHNNMHGGLTYNPANGFLYAETSSICDFKPWKGHIVAINTATARIIGSFYPVSGTSQQGGNGGGIWGGGGASIDPATNRVLIATGNADVASGIPQTTGDAERVVELSPNLSTVVASNYPNNLPSGPNLTDLDFGSTPVIFTPPGCPEMATALNKSGVLELYDVSTIAQGPVQYLEISVANDNGDFQGETTYDPVTNDLYVGLPATFGSYQAGMAAFNVQSNCTLNPVPAWSAQFGPDGSGTNDQVTRSAITVANGVAYIANSTGQTEFAFDAATGAQLWTYALPSGGRIGTLVANGMVYVSDNGGHISAFAPPSEHSVPKHRQLTLP